LQWIPSSKLLIPTILIYFQRGLPLSTDLVVFYVNEANPVTDVTAAQLQQLVDGATWLEVFGVGNDVPATFYSQSTGATHDLVGTNFS
jgi:hypothetical protein